MKKIKLIPIIYLILSCSIFVYTFYKSEIILEGVNFNYYLTYYIFSLISIFLSILSFFFSKKIQVNSFLVFTSTIICIYLIEFYLTNFNVKRTAADKIIEKKIKLDENFDQRSKVELYNDLKKDISNISLGVFPNNFLKNTNLEIFPLSGQSNTLTIHCNENGYYSLYKSDRFGFNNPDSEWEAEQIDYLLIGDSFVHGACVNRPNDIASILRGKNNKLKLPRSTAINLGQSGTGPLIQYATLVEYLKFKKVKNVIWFYFENDISKDITYELKNSILKKYLSDLSFRQDLTNNQSKINSLTMNKVMKYSSRKFNFTDFFKLASLRSLILHQNEKPSDKIWGKFSNILKLSNDLALKNGSKFYFVYLPSYETVIQKDNIENNYYQRVLSVVRNLNIPIIDIYENTFKLHSDPLSLFPYKLTGHYNEYGYREVVKNLYKNIN